MPYRRFQKGWRFSSSGKRLLITFSGSFTRVKNRVTRKNDIFAAANNIAVRAMKHSYALCLIEQTDCI